MSYSSNSEPNDLCGRRLTLISKPRNQTRRVLKTGDARLRLPDLYVNTHASSVPANDQRNRRDSTEAPEGLQQGVCSPTVAHPIGLGATTDQSKLPVSKVNGGRSDRSARTGAKQ